MVVAGPALASTLPAQSGTHRHCLIICRPTLSVNPGLVRSHLIGHPRVRSLASGGISRLASTNNFEIKLAVSVPTVIPRTSLYATVQWLPNASRGNNPYTEYTASELGNQRIRSNTPSVSLGAAVSLLPRKTTGGIVGLSAYVGDLYSTAQRPTDVGVFTHKLDVGLNAGFGVFSWLPSRTWMRGVTLHALLDYVATGLPKRGDEVPKGERVFLDNARSATFIVELALPVAPLAGGS